MFEAPMPFGDQPLWRVDLLRMDKCSCVLLGFHHIIVDTVSVELALAQALQHYLGLLAGQTDPVLQLESTIETVLKADEDYNASEQFNRDLAHWCDRYETLPPRLIASAPIRDTGPFADIAFREIPLNVDFLQAARDANLLPHRALFACWLWCWPVVLDKQTCLAGSPCTAETVTACGPSSCSPVSFRCARPSKTGGLSKTASPLSAIRLTRICAITACLSIPFIGRSD